MNEPRIDTYQFGNGIEHARGVVQIASRLAREDSSTYPIRSLATQITRDVPSKQTRQELEALYRWVRDHIRYRFDPLGVEWVQRPTRTVEEGAGDCDDMATLLSSLAQSLGHITRWRTVGPTKNTPKHIAIEAYARHPGAPDGEWISMDPVLEPARATAEPRAQLGTFGQRAPGAETFFTQGGSMLGGVVDARGRELWQWVGAPQMRAQVSPVPIDLRYREAGAPGDPRRIFAAYRAEMAASMRPGGALAGPFNDPTLGIGFLKLLKPLAKVASVVGVPGAGAVSAGLDIATSLTAKPKGAPGLPAAVPIASAPTAAAAGAAASTVQCATPQDVAALRAQFAKHIKNDPLLVKAANITIKNDKAAKKKAAARALDKRVEKRARALALKMVAKLRAGGWPAGARQAFNPAQGTYSVYAPTTIGALGLRPSLAVTFGETLGRTWVNVRPYSVEGHRRHMPGLGNAPVSSSTTAAASAAVAAVVAFVKRTKKAPAIAIQKVADFQTAIGMKVDGLWGPNTRRAAAYYTGRVESSLPPMAPAFARVGATWTPTQPTAPIVAPSAGLPMQTIPGPPPMQQAPTMQPPPPVAPAELSPSVSVLAPIAVMPTSPGLPPMPGSPAAPVASLPPLNAQTSTAPPPFPGDPGSVIVVPSDLAPFNEQWTPPKKDNDNTWMWIAAAWWWSKRKHARA